MKRLFIVILTATLALTGCTSQSVPADTESQVSEVSTSAEALDSALVGKWLQGEAVSAQLMLEDLTYEGLCNEWDEDPSPDSQYGQAYKRDLVRACESGRTSYSAPDCRAWISIDTMEQALSLPVDMNDVYEGAIIAVFAHPKFSITLSVSMSEYSYETDLQRCWGSIVKLGEILGPTVESQIYGDYAITSALNLKPLDEAFGDAPEEWFPVGDGIYAKWQKESQSCPNRYMVCNGVEIQTVGWCEDLVIKYDFLDEKEKVVAAEVVSMASESSYTPFPVMLGAEKVESPASQTRINSAECGSWIR